MPAGFFCYLLFSGAGGDPRAEAGICYQKKRRRLFLVIAFVIKSKGPIPFCCLILKLIIQLFSLRLPLWGAEEWPRQIANPREQSRGFGTCYASGKIDFKVLGANLLQVVFTFFKVS